MTSEQELERATSKVWADPLHWWKLASRAKKPRRVPLPPLLPLRAIELGKSGLFFQ